MQQWVALDLKFLVLLHYANKMSRLFYHNNVFNFIRWKAGRKTIRKIPPGICWVVYWCNDHQKFQPVTFHTVYGLWHRVPLIYMTGKQYAEATNYQEPGVGFKMYLKNNYCLLAYICIKLLHSFFYLFSIFILYCSDYWIIFLYLRTPIFPSSVVEVNLWMLVCVHYKLCNSGQNNEFYVHVNTNVCLFWKGI